MLRRLVIGIFATLAIGAAPAQVGKERGHYLFVWAGDQAKQGNDFLIVIDADPASPTYGKLVTGVGTDLKSVKPHHTEYEMPQSGMLFANDHDANRTFIFDLRNPLAPKVATSFESAGGYSMPHSFMRLPNGNVLASFQFVDHGGHMAMGGRTGGLVEIDDQGKVVRSVSNDDPALPGEGLLPYSLAVLPKIDRVIVTNSPMGDDYLLSSNTYQIFRLSDLKLLGTHRLDPGPNLSGHISPEEARIGPDGAAYIQTLSCGIQRVTGMETPNSGRQTGPPIPRQLVRRADHHRPLSGAKRSRHSRLYRARHFRWLGTARSVATGDNDSYAPHWTGWDAKTKRLVVTSGKKGDRMYLLKLDETTGALTIDDKFRDTDGKPGFSFANRKWPHGWTGEGNPHGAVFSR